MSSRKERIITSSSFVAKKQTTMTTWNHPIANIEKVHTLLRMYAFASYSILYPKMTLYLSIRYFSQNNTLPIGSAKGMMQANAKVNANRDMLKLC